jgi:hypothetical protein
MSLGEVFSKVPKYRFNMDSSWLGEMCPQISNFLKVHHSKEFLDGFEKNPLKPEAPKC